MSGPAANGRAGQALKSSHSAGIQTLAVWPATLCLQVLFHMTGNEVVLPPTSTQTHAWLEHGDGRLVAGISQLQCRLGGSHDIISKLGLL